MFWFSSFIALRFSRRSWSISAPALSERSCLDRFSCLISSRFFSLSSSRARSCWFILCFSNSSVFWITPIRDSPTLAISNLSPETLRASASSISLRAASAVVLRICLRIPNCLVSSGVVRPSASAFCSSTFTVSRSTFNCSRNRSRP